MHNRDDMIVFASSIQDLEHQLKEVIWAAGEYGIAFNVDTIRIEISMIIDGAMITCKVTDQPTLALNQEDKLGRQTRSLVETIWDHMLQPETLDSHHQ